MGFRLLPKSVMAIISRYFAELSSFRGHVKVVNLPSLIFSRETSKSTPTKHNGRAVLFAVAELLVICRCLVCVNKQQYNKLLTIKRQKIVFLYNIHH